MSEKYEKNIKNLQDMVDGNYKGKIQSGYEAEIVHREVGDTWTDSEGDQWEEFNEFLGSIEDSTDQEQE